VQHRVTVLGQDRLGVKLDTLLRGGGALEDGENVRVGRARGVAVARLKGPMRTQFL